MSAERKFADDGAALHACSEDSDRSAAYGHGSLMADGIDAAGHAAHDYESAICVP
jgi:hypothetical protein